VSYRFCVLAVGLTSLAITVGCEKAPTKEEIIAEYEASKVEQERVARLEEELKALQDNQATNAQDDQLRADHQKALERQLQDARKKAEQAVQSAKALEANKPLPPDPTTATDPKESTTRGEREERRKPTTINIPQGTRLVVSLTGALTTDTHSAGDAWEGRLTQDVTVDNAVVWTSGTSVSGLVSQSAPTGRLANGQGALGIRLTDVGGASIDGGIYVVTGDSKGGRNAAVIGGSAVLGALAGILSDKNNKRDHATGGAAAGAAVGTAIAAGTANTVITIPASTAITFSVPADEQVVVRNRRQ